ncbi:MAG: hypothetical protein QM723_07065 [Myxococcaceae bacterium]
MTAEAPAAGAPKKNLRDPAKLAAMAAKRKATTLVKQLEGSTSIDEFWDRIDKIKGKNSERAAGEGPGSAQTQLTAPAPGWPGDEQIAEVMPTMLGLWSQAEAGLAGTPFQLPPRKEVELRTQKGEQIVTEKVTIDPVVGLAQGTAPLMAKLGSKSVGSPLTLALFTVGMIFGPPAIQLGVGLGLAWWQNRDRAPKAKLSSGTAEPRQTGAGAVPDQVEAR